MKWLKIIGGLAGIAFAAYTVAKLLSAANHKREEKDVFDEQLAESEAGRMKAELKDSYDFIVVGSGAGGGPLAANLARAGFTVLLLEAGGDSGSSLFYQVPAFHGAATEHKGMRWDYFVRHYSDDNQQRRDSKFNEKNNGIWYPRAGTLGGCTAHNALITVYPHNSDWDEIAHITGDASWNSNNMRKYFQRLERCEYLTRPNNPMRSFLRTFAKWIIRAFGRSPHGMVENNPGRRGFDGWLSTNVADLRLGFRDRRLLKIIKFATEVALESDLESWQGILQRFTTTIRGFLERGESLLAGFYQHLDPNDWQAASESPEGLVITPLATSQGKRRGPREYILETKKRFPDKLFVRTHALVTKVLFGDNNVAIGVEFLDGAHLYRADPIASETSSEDGKRQRVHVNKEVILCAGAFNSPQLLKLSGIGPKEELQQLEIPVRVDLPGVGENLQDRYEVGVITEIKGDFSIFEGATLAPPEEGQNPDPAFLQWLSGKGVYTTNGVVIGIVKKSHVERTDPDLFIFGLPSNFKGYFPGYTTELTKKRNNFTWAILKAHTRNTAGKVTLRSKDPRDIPEINFHYFDESNDINAEDLESVVNGVKFVRGITQRASMLTVSEILPDKSIDTDDEIRQFIKDEAWGHHASCSNKMGSKDDPMAVVDSAFRVYGTQKLRVVDASVFPRIPGFFIALAIYMISEKASDVIIADAKS
jgi:choline dehydrogenase